jgi:hypothetical protein
MLKVGDRVSEDSFNEGYEITNIVIHEGISGFDPRFLEVV